MHRSQFRRRTRLRLLAIAVVALGSATSAQAANDFGMLGVSMYPTPCCNGASLQGSRVSIKIPSLVSTPSGTQALSNARGEGQPDSAGGGLIQIGAQQDNGYQLESDACETTSISYWAEVFDQSGSRCFFIGFASSYSSLTHKFSVQRQNPSTTWQAFMDGVAPQGKIITGTPSTTGNVGHVYAGGEIAYTTSSTFVTWSGTFGGNGNTPWQRYNGNLGWVTINSATEVCNGTGSCPPSTSGGGWSFNTNSFPTVWTINH